MTLVELLVATMMFLGLLAAVAPVFTTVINEQPKVSRGAARIAQAQALMERMGREIRQAYAVDSAAASQLVFRTYTRHATCGGTGVTAAEATTTQCRVTYACSGGTCTRTEQNADGTGSASPVQAVTGLIDNDVFTYTPSSTSPQFVEVTLAMPGRSAGEDAITLQGGFEMRNVSG